MKTSIDKRYTTLEQADKVREDLKEFKARYTDGDLLRTFCDTFDLYPAHSREVLSVRVVAFPGGTDYSNETHFSVDIIATDDTNCVLGFCTMHYYCDLELAVDTREYPVKLWDCKVYDERT